MLMVAGASTLFMDMIQDLGLFSLSVVKGPELSAGGKPDRMRTMGARDQSPKQFRLRQSKGSIWKN